MKKVLGIGLLTIFIISLLVPEVMESMERIMNNILSRVDDLIFAIFMLAIVILGVIAIVSVLHISPVIVY